MSRFDYGPLQTYEVTWKSGHVERIQCHQITFHSRETGIGAGLIGVQVSHDERCVQMHGQFDGHWRLVLSAIEDDIRTIRLVTGGEEFAGERFGFDAEDGGAA
ncbi:hypothetical protein [Nonomuraea bangladeshensis]|uniref:hypothetical protein n=1 Tax=Nonomuraea bangladeshensis TaxID=404385 RepID=UPI003C2C177E